MNMGETNIAICRQPRGCACGSRAGAGTFHGLPSLPQFDHYDSTSWTTLPLVALNRLLVEGVECVVQFVKEQHDIGLWRAEQVCARLPFPCISS